MNDLTAVEMKAFVPARDFALAKTFYEELGFVVEWSEEGLAGLRCGPCRFLLQDFYEPEHASNFMMHLMVRDVDAWWRQIEEQGLVAKYGVIAEPPADRPWGLRDLVLSDPTGVLWRIAQAPA